MSEEGESQNREPETLEEERKRASVITPFLGRALCGLGILLCIAVFVFGGVYTANVSAGALGIVLGIVGYFMGSNRLGTVTIIISIITIFYGLAAGQDLIPGFRNTDRDLPAFEPRSDG